ncbi:hypothetical protein T440DRAFT_473374, partial [Plenodomus tracheiphilus IPT5]
GEANGAGHVFCKADWRAYLRPSSCPFCKTQISGFPLAAFEPTRQAIDSTRQRSSKSHGHRIQKASATRQRVARTVGRRRLPVIVEEADASNAGFSAQSSPSPSPSPLRSPPGPEAAIMQVPSSIQVVPGASSPSEPQGSCSNPINVEDLTDDATLNMGDYELHLPRKPSGLREPRFVQSAGASFTSTMTVNRRLEAMRLLWCRIIMTFKTLSMIPLCSKNAEMEALCRKMRSASYLNWEASDYSRLIEACQAINNVPQNLSEIMGPRLVDIIGGWSKEIEQKAVEMQKRSIDG